MAYIDHYWQSADEPALATALREYVNTLGPIRDEAHNLWYGAVRAEAQLSPPNGCAAADPQMAQTILGIWA